MFVTKKYMCLSTKKIDKKFMGNFIITQYTTRDRRVKNNKYNVICCLQKLVFLNLHE